MKKEDIKILLKYSDEYIAFVGSILNIIAHGKSMSEVAKQLKAEKIENATISYVPPVNKSFSPLCQ